MASHSDLDSRRYDVTKKLSPPVSAPVSGAGWAKILFEMMKAMQKFSQIEDYCAFNGFMLKYKYEVGGMFPPSRMA